jgi:hypothetical protein
MGGLFDIDILSRYVLHPDPSTSLEEGAGALSLRSYLSWLRPVMLASQNYGERIHDAV